VQPLRASLLLWDQRASWRRIEFTLPPQDETLQSENDVSDRNQPRVDQLPPSVFAHNVPTLEQPLEPSLFDQLVIVNRTQFLARNEPTAVVTLLKIRIRIEACPRLMKL